MIESFWILKLLRSSREFLTETPKDNIQPLFMSKVVTGKHLIMPSSYGLRVLQQLEMLMYLNLVDTVVCST